MSLNSEAYKLTDAEKSSARCGYLKVVVDSVVRRTGFTVEVASHWYHAYRRSLSRHSEYQQPLAAIETLDVHQAIRALTEDDLGGVYDEAVAVVLDHVKKLEEVIARMRADHEIALTYVPAFAVHKVAQ